MSDAAHAETEMPTLFPESALAAVEREAPSQSPLVKDEVERDDFDWFTSKEVIIERQPSIAVYRNGRDHIVIRAENEFDPDADQCIQRRSARRALRNTRRQH